MTALCGADQNGHTPARPVGRRSGVGGAWCGLELALLWAPMAAVIPLFPDLDSRGEVVSFWQDHGTLTLRVMVLVVAGYPLLLAFLADVATRAGRNEGRPVLSWAALVAGVMFMTGLNASLGLAAAAGMIIDQGTDLSAAYGLHVAAVVLAAPFTGAGVAFFCSWRCSPTAATLSRAGCGGRPCSGYWATSVRSVGCSTSPGRAIRATASSAGSRCRWEPSWRGPCAQACPGCGKADPPRGRGEANRVVGNRDRPSGTSPAGARRHCRSPCTLTPMTM